MIGKNIGFSTSAWTNIKQWIYRNPWRALLIATVVLATIVHLSAVLFVPPSKEKRAKEIEVTRGMSLKALSNLLKREGIIRSRGYFELFGRLQGISRKIRIGYYELDSQMNMWQVLGIFRNGRIIEYAVTIPEGYNLFQIGYVLAATPLANEARQFILLARDRNVAQKLNVSADTLEGYLFPDTYHFPKGIMLEEIAQQMTQRYNSVFTDDYRARARKIGFTEHQIVTLASIIEKEARLSSERELISAVYHNRLKKGMRLQADPTAVYGKEAWVRKVTPRDLKRNTPYNTYIHKGLPPGPIANPGQGAIFAALYPATVDYLYFVAQGDGSHSFSKDYASHLQAIERYRRNQRNR